MSVGCQLPRTPLHVRHFGLDVKCVYFVAMVPLSDFNGSNLLRLLREGVNKQFHALEHEDYLDISHVGLLRPHKVPPAELRTLLETCVGYSSELVCSKAMRASS